MFIVVGPRSPPADKMRFGVIFVLLQSKFIGVVRFVFVRIFYLRDICPNDLSLQFHNFLSQSSQGDV